MKIATAMGCKVTVLSTSEDKRAEGMAMGATHFVVSKDEAAMQARPLTRINSAGYRAQGLPCLWSCAKMRVGGRRIKTLAACHSVVSLADAKEERYV